MVPNAQAGVNIWGKAAIWLSQLPMLNRVKTLVEYFLAGIKASVLCFNIRINRGIRFVTYQAGKSGAFLRQGHFDLFLVPVKCQSQFDLRQRNINMPITYYDKPGVNS
ncbi:hypothetical protein C1G86_0984 [Dehalococcoides mccartyi]|uniref:Uncharacterized protein n=1 Tax=Dehalococcoides mccartyi TaxID=61435 RepID=A0A1S7AU32_9CHLR|nr:hypothetical protein dcmb_966 [Dehalococcoides mccartyi DCMB5]AQX73375.1 hypothetical protein B1775_04290 [Dehalococcoides mccartyi]RAL70438.1 hypothetical protein C1G86_0984 [Dehalococcoides mccartyi]